MIRDKDIKEFWWRWRIKKLSHLLVQILAFPFIFVLWFTIDLLVNLKIDTPTIFYCLLFVTQLNWLYGYIARYVFKVRYNIWWFWLNDETDFGEEWWLKREKLKPGFYSAFRWSLRNIAWNYLKSDNIPSHSEYYDVKVIKDTLDFSQASLKDTMNANRLTHASRDKGIYGEKEVYYRLKDGKVYGRKSKADKDKERMYGVGNQRYILRRKPIL